jgi:hypothetical protein
MYIDFTGAEVTLHKPNTEVLCSNPGRDIGYPDGGVCLPQSIHADAWREPRLGHNLFSPNGFHLIIQLSTCLPVPVRSYLWDT